MEVSITGAVNGESGGRRTILSSNSRRPANPNRRLSCAGSSAARPSPRRLRRPRCGPTPASLAAAPQTPRPPRRLAGRDRPVRVPGFIQKPRGPPSNELVRVAERGDHRPDGGRIAKIGQRIARGPAHRNRAVLQRLEQIGQHLRLANIAQVHRRQSSNRRLRISKAFTSSGNVASVGLIRCIAA